MLLLAIAIAPSIAICLYIFFFDRYNREPPINLIMSFMWGMVILMPAVMIEVAFDKYIGNNLASIIAGAYLGVGLVEEAGKFLIVRYYCFTRKSFDEPLDGIVYSVLVAMGFATVENIFYVHQYGISTALLRMITTVPAHATFAIIMGYFVGKAKFDPINRGLLFLKGVSAATLVHGTYDVFLFLNQNEWLKQNISELVLFTGAIVSLFFAMRLSHKLIRRHQAVSRQLFYKTPVLTLRNAAVQDLGLIHDLCLQVWPQAHLNSFPRQQIKYMLRLLFRKEALQQQMADNHQFIIIYNAGVPVGFASFSQTEPTIYQLHQLYVLPVHRGRGAGRFVIEQIISNIITSGGTALRLNINRNDRAKDFYQHLGFDVIKTEDVDLGYGFIMNGYVMERRLDEPVL